MDSHPVTDDGKPEVLISFLFLEPINSWIAGRDYLMERPVLELEINYSITGSGMAGVILRWSIFVSLREVCSKSGP